MKQIRAIELFAGIGGFRLATETLGIKTTWANDISDVACSVYQDRFGVGSIVKGDIWQHQHEVPAHDLLTVVFPVNHSAAPERSRESGITGARSFRQSLRSLKKSSLGILFSRT